MDADQLKITLKFLEGLSITVTESCFSAENITCVEGVSCLGGEISYDPASMLYPGDLFYVAGRIAVSEIPEKLDDTPRLDPAEEMAALAWAYAACTHLSLPPDIVFHPHGYHGQSQELIHTYSSGAGPGTPMLQLWGMTESYPLMDHWIRSKTPALT